MFHCQGAWKSSEGILLTLRTYAVVGLNLASVNNILMSFKQTSSQGNDLLARVNISYNLDTKFN